MATYSSNTTIRISGAVANAQSVNRNNGGTSTVTLYTAPANSEAIITLFSSYVINNAGTGTGNGGVQVGGVTILSTTTNTTFPTLVSFNVGPGQSVVIFATSGGVGNNITTSATIVGTQYTNSP